MSGIKKEVKTGTTRTAFRIPVELADRIEQYSRFLSSSPDHVVTQALTWVIGRDREFVRHLAQKTIAGCGDESTKREGSRAGTGSKVRAGLP